MSASRADETDYLLRPRGAKNTRAFPTLPTIGAAVVVSLAAVAVLGRGAIGHGAAAMLKDRLCDNSDATVVDVCDRCGMLATPAHSKRFGESVRGSEATCKACGTGSRCRRVPIPYSMKLLHQELTSMMITPRLRLEKKTSL